ncbi:MAG: transketolase [Rhodospirillaceae bacterium TMED8]|nr:MAG: transketolase [Rhodospirillaceae bacterium TMED8]
MTRAAQLSALDKRSMQLRGLVVRALVGGGRGHIGSSMSLIEILRVFYDDILRVRAGDPTWADRDRFILSKGHGCLAQYALLADKGFFSIEELDHFCRQSSFLGGHPEFGKVPGVEASTGALGHGLSIGLGMALAARMKKAAWQVYVVLGDGEINEGSVWEAAMSAGKHNLDNLTAVIDYNKIQSYGFTENVQPLEPLADKWRSFGFSATAINGHDVNALRQLLSSLPIQKGRPTAIICHTVKGKGVSFAENNPSWHHKSNLPPDQVAEIYDALERKT